MSGRNEPLTLDVPTAGKRYYNLGRDASYSAARRGDLPTIRVGRNLRVPVRAMDAKIEAVVRKATAE
jgi:hypothetical protein